MDANSTSDRSLTLALVQMEPVLGDLPANLDRILALTGEAAAQDAKLIIFPELALTGYNPELLGERLVRLSRSVQDEPIQRLARAAGEEHVYLVFGFIEEARTIPGVVYNSSPSAPSGRLNPANLCQIAPVLGGEPCIFDPAHR